MPTSDIHITPLVLSYDELLLELVKGTATIDMIDKALYFLDCVQEYVFDETIALQKLNGNQELTEHQKQLLHRQFCSTVGIAIEEGRAMWRGGAEGTWEELNQLLELNGQPEIPIPFVDNMPIMRHYTPSAVALAVARNRLPYLVFPYQDIIV